MRINKWLKTMTIALGLSLAALPAYADVINGSTFGLDSSNLNGTINLNGAGNIINWDKFNIGNGSVLDFVNSADKWAVLNRVTGGSLSQLDGTINASLGGTVFLVNPNGIVFGKDFTVNANTFVASTLKLLSDDDFYKYASGESNTLNFAGDSDKEIIVKGMNAEGYVALIGKSITVDSDVNVSPEELKGDKVTFYAPYELALCAYSLGEDQDNNAGDSDNTGGEIEDSDNKGDSGSGAGDSSSAGVIDVILYEMEKEGTAAKTGQQVAQDTKVNGSLSNFIGSQNTEFTVSDNDKKEDEEKSDGTVGGALKETKKDSAAEGTVVETKAGNVIIKIVEKAAADKKSKKVEISIPSVEVVLPKDAIINAKKNDKSLKLNVEKSFEQIKIAPGVLVLSPVNLGDLNNGREGTPKGAQGEKKFKKVLPASTQKSDMAQGVKIHTGNTKQENELPFTPARETVTNKIIRK